MRTLWLRVRAPFAAFRWLQAGVYRATSTIIPPSAVWGLALNLAGFDTRDRRQERATTVTRQDSPRLQIAIGQISPGEVSTLYQQLHSYPVGASGKELAARTHGSKYWIAPVRREVLVGLDCAIGVRGGEEILEKVPNGLKGDGGPSRYGLPFAGDNNFLFDRIDVLDGAHSARWLVPLQGTEQVSAETSRLLVSVDREDSSRTKTALFAFSSESVDTPPEAAWIWVPNSPSG